MPIRTPSRPKLARLAASGLLLPGLLAPTGLRAQSLTALAAASLTDALTEARAAWARQGPPMPRLSLAASSTPARQIEQGAPASLFAAAAAPVWTAFPLPAGSGPHDVAPAPDGTVWFTAQAAGKLGWLDPRSGHVDEFPLGPGSAPHGVTLGPDGAPWVTDGGLNAVLRFDPGTHAVRRFPLPASRPGANLNAATFDRSGALWFTGQSGVYGRVEPRSGAVRVWDAPRGPGPYGITTTRSGAVYFASLAGGYIARIDPASGAASVIEPPTPHQGAPPRLAGRAGRAVGERVPRGADRALPVGGERLAVVAPARRAATQALRGLRGRAGHRLGERLRRRGPAPL